MHCQTWIGPVLPSLDTVTTDELIAFTRDVVRLHPAEEWHAYVAEAIWKCSLPDIPPLRPVAYVRRVARRLRRAAEGSSLGRQVVRDRRRRVVGHVTVCGYVRPDGSISEEALDGGTILHVEARGYVPAGQDGDIGEGAAGGRRRRWVDTDDPDERRVQKAQVDGIPRREMADRLGWTVERVVATWWRLYRRRRAIPE